MLRKMTLEHDFPIDKKIFSRYTKELEGSHWNSVRTGMALGLLIGWFYFMAYIMYGSGFIFGLLLMHYEGDDQSMISDILVVSCL